MGRSVPVGVSPRAGGILGRAEVSPRAGGILGKAEWGRGSRLWRVPAGLRCSLAGSVPGAAGASPAQGIWERECPCPSAEAGMQSWGVQQDPRACRGRGDPRWAHPTLWGVGRTGFGGAEQGLLPLAEGSPDPSGMAVLGLGAAGEGGFTPKGLENEECPESLGQWWPHEQSGVTCRV